ncbi:hypothetical protein BS47DRAFT_1393228 [Hydnum rufescens UP504]|uniref:Pentatricopeptide repeat-containing protein n=1 Tax=Hydnum rufescens UP504 TaxID=1448309 RepID=A0A9P6AXH7_9AGAM|nr:hypothetical protein BS47DRAFT_1393228 [Hydnum rufescens UP504]
MRITAHVLKGLRSGRVNAIFRDHAPTPLSVTVPNVMHVLARHRAGHLVPELQRDGHPHNVVELHYSDEMLEDFYKSLIKPEHADQSRNMKISHPEFFRVGSPVEFADMLIQGQPFESISTPTSRALHVEAYIRAGRLKEACDLIHTYEDRNLLPSMKTYSDLICRLLHRTYATPSTRALAWDMFSHMRYVAHPIPDAHLYSIMIRACADAPVPQAERALDLFTEMRIDNRIEPTRDAYNWTILACARASKDFTQDAFRLAQEMFDGFRAGDIQLRPDFNTFCALLENAKRTGDLKRARAILAELINAYKKGDESLRPNEELMAHVFQAYTSYRPPFNRDVVRRTHETNTDSVISGTGEISPTKVIHAYLDNTVDLPQSHAETVAEAAALYNRIRDDISPLTPTKPPPGPPNPGFSIFSHVTATPDLLNSYLSVYFAHASLASSRRTYDTIFSEAGQHDRRDAVPFARSVWEEWRKIEDSELARREQPAAPPNTSPRTVEKLWSSIIRVLTLAGRLDEALDLVKEFAVKYPPLDIRHPRPSQASTTAPAPPREYRTHLTGSRPLVRLTTNTYIADGTVPPHFIFRDIEILHHRLIVHNRLKDVGYLKWLQMSYQGALKKRREDAIGIVTRATNWRSSGVNDELRVAKMDDRALSAASVHTL